MVRGQSSRRDEWPFFTNFKRNVSLWAAGVGLRDSVRAHSLGRLDKGRREGHRHLWLQDQKRPVVMEKAKNHRDGQSAGGHFEYEGGGSDRLSSGTGTG